ncbi:hypothetical protein PUN28_020334 [Cardiocondyla obscurior]|uniref:Uncharacterized protein n=1 Tax=Cardiocondyla obscurior TaxID=286306 RepID=A0AAW2E7Y9_9HYME
MQILLAFGRRQKREFFSLLALKILVRQKEKKFFFCLNSVLPTQKNSKKLKKQKKQKLKDKKTKKTKNQKQKTKTKTQTTKLKKKTKNKKTKIQKQTNQANLARPT